MSDADFEFVPDHPDWHAVLQAYLHAQNSLLQQRRASLAIAKTESGSDQDAGNNASALTDPARAHRAGDNFFAENSGDSDNGTDLPLDNDEHSGDDDDCSEEDCGRRPQSQPGGTPWVTRLRTVDGVATSELSRVHGQLIAFGFLKCDVQDRTLGTIYQVTPDGRSAFEKFERRSDESRAGVTSTDDLVNAGKQPASVCEGCTGSSSQDSTGTADTGCEQPGDDGNGSWSLLPPDESSSSKTESAAA